MAETAWFVEGLRATLFTSAAAPQSPRSWWDTFSGVPSPQLQVAEGPVGHASAQAEVPGENALLSLACQPGRIDWSYIYATTASEGKLTLAGNAEFGAALRRFMSRLQQWLPLAPVHTRVALGAGIQIPVESKTEGYRRLQDYLPYLKLDADNSSDLSYRINRPRISKRSPFELKINRVSNWSVRTIHMQVAAQDQSAPALLLSAMHCRLDLDLSTAAENSNAIDPPLSAALFSELEELALEIAVRGDQP